MSISRPTARLLGLLAVLLVASYASATAYAAGPFLYHRALQGSGSGVKIAASEPEGIFSSATEQELIIKASETRLMIRSSPAELKGIIYNNALQGQAKVLMTFVEPKVVAPPEYTGCQVKIGTNDTIKLVGHQAWTWNGTKAQLGEQSQKEQKPDWIFLPQELPQGAEGLSTSQVLFVVTFTGGGPCSNFTEFPITGSVGAAVEPANTGEWSPTETIKFLPDLEKQHFWNGQRNVGVETAAIFAHEPVTFVGQYKIKTTGRQGGAPQEVARFEN